MISDAALDHLQRLVSEPDFAGTRYEALSVLGRGGIGTVYLARDSVLDRDVAVKVLDSLVGDQALAEHLQQEARILARLEHPGVVPVHDFGRLADGRLFYAMKRVRGQRLDRWAATADPHARLAVFLRMCDAVAFAHAHGVIHRDLKPENVMVGEFGEVLVLDWGIAGFVVGTIAISTCWSSLPMWRASCRALRFVPTPKPSSIGSHASDADTESRSLWCWPTS